VNFLIDSYKLGPASAVFTHARYKGDFANISKGIGIFHIGAQSLSAFEIPLPPISGQIRIVVAELLHLCI
jgi:restriction endonuclease S subunit